MKVERDLLPVKAVRCHLAGHLVNFYKSCIGKGTRSKKPCGHYIPTYKCNYIVADQHPAYKGGKMKK